MNRSISAACSSFPSVPRNPGAKISTSTGAAMTPITVTTNSKAPSVPATPETSSRVSSWLRLCRYSEMTGTKPCENDPSANRRRRKLGILMATRKASMSALAPNTWA